MTNTYVSVYSVLLLFFAHTRQNYTCHPFDQKVVTKDGIVDHFQLILDLDYTQFVQIPTQQPTAEPTESPTFMPTLYPTFASTRFPTADPIERTTQQPTNDPSYFPSGDSTTDVSAEPTVGPTENPTYSSTDEVDLLSLYGMITMESPI